MSDDLRSLALTKYYEIKNTNNLMLMQALIELTSKYFCVTKPDAQMIVTKVLEESDDPLDFWVKLKGHQASN